MTARMMITCMHVKHGKCLRNTTVKNLTCVLRARFRTLVPVAKKRINNWCVPNVNHVAAHCVFLCVAGVEKRCVVHTVNHAGVTVIIPFYITITARRVLQCVYTVMGYIQTSVNTFLSVINVLNMVTIRSVFHVTEHKL